MLHHNVLIKFNLYFPHITSDVETWFPNGRNSIRIRLHDLREFIFTYNDEKDWCFETKESFIKRLKGEKRM